MKKTYQTDLLVEQISFPITLKGQVDRIDVFDGEPRVIDFKTGSVILGDVEIVNWEDITSDYKKNAKAFQVLFYALLLEKNRGRQITI